MPVSLRSRRIQLCYERAAKQNILWVHRRNAAYSLSAVRKLGEKTQLRVQKLLNDMRSQYDDLEIQKQIDELQEKLDRQRDAMKRHLAKEVESKSQKPKTEENSEPKPPLVLSDGTKFDPFSI